MCWRGGQRSDRRVEKGRKERRDGGTEGRKVDGGHGSPTTTFRPSVFASVYLSCSRRSSSAGWAKSRGGSSRENSSPWPVFRSSSSVIVARRGETMGKVRAKSPYASRKNPRKPSIGPASGSPYTGPASRVIEGVTSR